MDCKVEGCDRAAAYKALCLCQRHYFRQWRYGTTELTKSRRYRQENPEGYQWIYEPDHPLRHRTSGYVAEHRAVLFAAIGPADMKCELCGCGLTWKTCKVDHIDRNPKNNEHENLRPTCNRCNTHRDMTAAHTWSRTMALTFDGETKTPHEWGKDPRVSISGRQIRERKRAGMSDEDAIFSPKKTHKNSSLLR